MSLYEDGRPNLAVVDEAFGSHADLYTDVLQVQPNAGSEQIQDAYFDRRNELFQLLADIDNDQEQDSITESHRRHAERKMDAVVCGVRILGDPDLRLSYDDMRAERLRARQKRRSPNRRRAIPDDQPEDERVATNTRRTINNQERHLQQQLQQQLQLNSSMDSSPASSPTTASEFSSRYSANGNTTTTTNNVSSIDTGNYISKSHRTRKFAKSHDSSNGLPPSPKRKSPSPKRMSASQSKRKSSSPPPKPRGRVVTPDSNSTRRPTTSRAAKSIKTTTRQLKAPREEDQSTTLSMASESLQSQGEDDTTLFTAGQTDDDISVSESILVRSQRPSGIVDRIRTEIFGVIEDTSRSFEQVLNAFTLQEEDIKAVMGRIDKAKKQINRGSIVYDSDDVKSASSRKAPSPRKSSGRKPSGRKSPKPQRKSRK